MFKLLCKHIICRYLKIKGFIYENDILCRLNFYFHYSCYAKRPCFYFLCI